MGFWGVVFYGNPLKTLFDCVGYGNEFVWKGGGIMLLEAKLARTEK